MQCIPGFLVYFCLESSFEGLVRIIGAEEIGMADKEAFLVVVCVNEPAGYPFGSVASDFAGVGVEYVHTVNFYLNPVIFDFEDVDIRFAEDNEEIALAGVFEIVGHVQIGIHPGLKHWYATEFVKLR